MFVPHRKHTYRPYTACYEENFTFFMLIPFVNSQETVMGLPGLLRTNLYFFISMFRVSCVSDVNVNAQSGTSYRSAKTGVTTLNYSSTCCDLGGFYRDLLACRLSDIALPVRASIRLAGVALDSSAWATRRSAQTQT
jgi:hypothetical protein